MGSKKGKFRKARTMNRRHRRPKDTHVNKYAAEAERARSSPHRLSKSNHSAMLVFKR